jgi:hypothetical protein
VVEFDLYAQSVLPYEIANAISRMRWLGRFDEAGALAGFAR